MTNDENIKLLKRLRGVIKSKLTLFKRFIDGYEQNPDIDALTLRYQKIRADTSGFEAMQTEIEGLDDNFEAQLAERSEFEENCLIYFAKAEKYLKDNNTSVDERTSAAAPQTTQAVDCSQVKLPPILISKFDGKYEDWPSFCDAFKSTFHNNTRLSNVEKLIYLKSFLSGRAEATISSLTNTNINYSVAWDLLEKTYHDPNFLTMKHVEAFFDLSLCTRPSATSIGELLSNARKHYRALEAMNEPFLHFFPIFAIISKLDDETRVKWKEHLQASRQNPTIELLLEFLHDRQKILEDAKTNKQEKSQKSHTTSTSKQNNSRSVSTPKSSYSAINSPYCNICKDTHFTHACSKLTEANIETRANVNKERRLCFNCLKTNHSVRECHGNGCKKCGRKHHTLLHREASSPKQQSNIACLISNTANQILLATARINLIDRDGNAKEARMLLDSCSQTNFLSKALAEQLNLPLKNVRVPVTGINDSINYYHQEITCSVKSRINDYSADLNLLIRDKFNDLLPSFYFDRSKLKIPSNITLADPKFDQSDEIDGLIGASLFYKLLCIGQININEQNAVAQKTRFGWIISGPISTLHESKPVRCNFSSEVLNNQLNKFWEIEEVPAKRLLSPEEALCEQHYAKHTSRDPQTGKYIVKLPFNEKLHDLGESYSLALKRFYSLERSLDKSEENKRQYTDFMREYEALGHMTERKDARDGFYLPHHPVFKSDSLTTQLRVVFDASAKTSTGVSLNNSLMNGPVIQDDLLSLTLRFRTYTYVLTADIEKMYRQILMHPDDRKYQRVLWRENRNEPIKIYDLNTVTYGTTSASFLATRTLVQLAEDEATDFTRAKHTLKNDFYMDDLLTGAQSISEAKRLRDELIHVTKKCGFNLRKWASNNSQLVSDLSSNNDDAFISLNLDDTIKTLGLYWNAKQDTISYTVKASPPEQSITKRSVLSEIAKIFDPLGLLGPVIIRAKIFMQRLWQLKVDWDESLPADCYAYWQNFKMELNSLHDISIKRHVLINDTVDQQLHGFCDASEKAYGACIYIRARDQNNKVKVQLLCAKSKVTPLKSHTLPRLELCAALLLSYLFQIVKSSLHNIQFNKIVFWSDSTIALHWIKTQPHTLKTYVSNRVAEIQNITSSYQWRHVRSEDNPADYISRGLAPTDLVKNDLWYNGPAWLAKQESAWPVFNLEPIDIPEQRVTITFQTNVRKNDLLHRYSSFKKLKRMTAYLLRFCNNCRRKKEDRIFDNSLSAAELESATNVIIREVQREGFNREIQLITKHKHLPSNLACLAPFIDGVDILRVGGRLSNASVPYQSKHQALIPRKHHVTDLIIEETHTQAFHAGAQASLSLLREHFWIINGREYVKGLIHKCFTCRRAKPAFFCYPMADLPKGRVELTRAFLHTGVDYCGPFYIKEKRLRNRNKIKVYIAVFVCLATRACHLEVVEDLTTESFLAVLRRFIARRGKPEKLYSDNAKNFVGAKGELDELAKFVKSDSYYKAVKNELASLNVPWHFIPPRSPHFGGLWEAAVKSFKHHFTRVIGDHLLSFGEFLTLIIEIESILNSRPITPLSSDPNDLKALTPYHFLIGETILTIPEQDLREVQFNRLSAWQRTQHMRQHFWTRWYKEYLHTQTVRKKWHTGEPTDIKIGAIVSVKDKDLPPMQWPLATIIATHPGDDGIVRVVTIRTTHGEYKRAVKNLAPLLFDD